MFYYVPPQLWAWAGWRVKKVQRTVDLVLCSLPFEPDWYRARGVTQAEYVGHPFFDELAERELDESFLAQVKANAHHGPLVAILPGSRTQELTRNLPIMIRAAAKLRGSDPRRGSPWPVCTNATGCSPSRSSGPILAERRVSPCPGSTCSPRDT